MIFKLRRYEEFRYRDRARGVEGCRNVGVEEWRYGGMEEWRYGGMEEWRNGRWSYLRMLKSLFFN
mgnify:CR=1 FL=1